MCRMSGKLLRYLHQLALVSILPACTFVDGRTDVLVTSDPAGATVLLDGQDTGETTPIRLDIGDYAFAAGYFGSDHEVTVRKQGFEPETRRLYHHRSHYTSSWKDGATPYLLVTAPIFWSVGDWFTPFGVQWDYSPNELHIKLYPPGQAPGKRP